MKVYIISGEASGDLHASNLLRAMRHLDPTLSCRAWGGDLLKDAGADLRKHYRELAFMGFVEVVKNLRTIMRNFDFCKQELLDYQPDTVILVDYPGFNLRMAKWLRKSAHLFQKPPRIVYYISPQIWAWHTSRVHDIRRDVDQMLVILPFEVEFYKRYNVAVTFVGHPLLDVIEDVEMSHQSAITSEKPIIALLPGSRKQEVALILPQMLSVVDQFPDYQFVVAGSTALDASHYQNILQAYPNVEFRQGATYDILKQASAALVKSGTSTLETALWGVPQVVCYKGNALSYAIAKRLVQIKYISLVNLIADAPVVKELIQNELNQANIQRELAQILESDNSAAMKQRYRQIREQLGGVGASERAARVILEIG
jgi:lipid-A-disaccharide synthase